MKKGKETTIEEIQAMQEELALAIAGEKSAKKTPSKKLKKKNTIVNVVFVVFVVFALTIIANSLYLKSKGEAPSLFGFYLFEIKTGSMDPTLPVGTNILSKKPASADEIKVGTILTFKNPNNLTVTHRVTDIVLNEDGALQGFETKGDNPINDTDPYITPYENVIGVYITTLPF